MQTKAHMAHVDLMAATPTGTSTATPEPCPGDPDQWVLVDIEKGLNELKRIEPACVYDGLGRTIAWMLAIHEGYTRTEATQLLGLEAAPVRPLPTPIKVMNMALGTTRIANLSTIPLEPALSEWWIDLNELPAVVYVPLGCIRGTEMVGNEMRSWNEGYPVICYVAEDNGGASSILKLDQYVFSASISTNWRSWLYFGYHAGLKRWEFLGKDTLLHLDLDPKTMAENEAEYSQRFGGEIWNAEWLLLQYGLKMKPLPDHWQSAQDPNELRAMFESTTAGPTP